MCHSAFDVSVGPVIRHERDVAVPTFHRAPTITITSNPGGPVLIAFECLVQVDRRRRPADRPIEG